MSKYRPGDAVQIANNLWEARKRGQIYFPPTIMPLLGKHVTIAEVVEGIENDLYFIFEDGQRFMYPVRVFMEDAEPLPSERADSVRHWSDEEIARAQSLICELLALPESGENAGAAYRFIDLVSQDQTRNPNVRPCVLLLQSSLSAQDIKVYAGTADEHDEPNVYIGMAGLPVQSKTQADPQMDHAPEQKERGEAVMDLKELMARQREIYDRKNADYGNSFHLTVERFGPVAALTRISDTMERMKVLQGTSAQTRDEALRDTVSDALNYLLMFSAALILLNWRLDEESQVEGEAENVTLIHRLMDNIARDELLAEEKVEVASLFEIWDSLCDTMMEAVREDDMKKIDDILIVNNYLSGLMALYLLRLA